MPKVKMMSGIAAISGKFGNMYFRTDKRTGRVSLCHMPQKKAATAPTEQQQKQKQRFATIAKIVRQMIAAGAKKSRKQLWKIATEAYDAANQ